MTESLDSVVKRLRDIEKTVQSDVFEFSVGVSHSALDEERERNSRIREKVESTFASLKELKHSDAEAYLRRANQLLKAATANTDTLRYLESISCLEGIFTDVANAATVTSLDLSRENATSKAVYSTRLLDENVQQCWEYTAQLSGLAALHLNAAADYHQFNHSINEIRAHAKQMLKVSEKCLSCFQPEGRIGEASMLYTEMEARLKVFADLSARAQKLLLTANKIVPISNRLLEVHNGKVSQVESAEQQEEGPLQVQVLMTFVGSKYTAQKGECLELLDTTESPHLWKVKTPKGSMYLPSIACLVISSNQDLVEDAKGTAVEVVRAWDGCLKNYRKQLAIYYYKYMKNLSGVCSTDEKGATRFLDDLERQLIVADVDDGKLANIYNRIRPTLHAGRRGNAGDEVWNQNDVVILHQPLLCLKEHMLDFRRLENFSGSHIQATKEYISNFATEARSMTKKLENLRITHDQNRAQLKELCDRVQNWRSVHDDSITTPRWGMGRLVLSRLASNSETSSGVSSDDMAAVEDLPRAPSPYGRITVRPLIEPSPPTSSRSQETQYYLASDSQSQHSPIGVSALQPPERQNVFACAATLNPQQIEAAVTVKRKETKQMEQKVVRDVATQILVFRRPRQSQTECQTCCSHCSKVASTQFERPRVDSVTQIDVIKAPKEQQVTAQIIRSAMQIEETTPSLQSGAAEVQTALQQRTYTTNNPQVANISSTAVHLPSCDLQTQVGEMAKPPSGRMQTSGPATCCCELGVKASLIDSANLEFRSGDYLVAGDFATGKMLQADAGIQAQPDVQTLNLAALERDVTSLDFETNASLNSARLQTNQPCVCSLTMNGTVGTARQPVSETAQSNSSYVWDSSQVTNQPGVCNTNVKTGEKLAGLQFTTRPNAGVETVAYQARTGCCTCQCGNDPTAQSSSTSISTTPSNGTSGTSGDTLVNQTFSNSEVECRRVCPVHQGSSTPRIPQIYVRCQTGIGRGLREVQEASCLGKVKTNMSTKSVPCQVGIQLVPCEIKVAPYKMGVENMESAKRLGLCEDTLLCPASVDVQPVLTETGGIQILDLKEVNRIGIQTEYGSCTAEVEKIRSQGKVAVQQPSREPCFLEFKASNSKPLSLGTVSVAKKSADYTATLQTLTPAECQFRIQDVKVGTCGAAPAEASQKRTASFGRDRLDADFVAPKDSRTAGAVAGSNFVSCSTQVGTMLKPAAIHMTNMQVNSRSFPMTNSVVGRIDSVMCPSTVQLIPTLTDNAGIQVMNIKDVGEIDMCLDNALFEANVTSATQETRSTAEKGLGLSQASFSRGTYVAVTAKTVNEIGANATSSQPYGLQNMGLQLNIREGQVGVICNSCRGTGVHMGMDNSRSQTAVNASATSNAALGRSTTSSKDVRTTSCQVGTLLAPTTVQISEVALQSRNADFSNLVGLKPGAVVYPAAIQMKSMLTDSSGIQVAELKDMSTMQVQSNGGIYTASVHTMGSAQRERIQSNLQSATPAFMDVQYGKTGITIGQTPASALKESTALSHSYALDNLGCKLTIEKMEEGNVCSTCQARGNFAVSGTGQTSMRTPGQAGQLTSNAALGRSTTSSKDVRTTSCQVGTLLAPTTVQISEVALQSRNADFSNLVGLKPGAVVYPAAIQMKSMLTDSSGIQVAELKDMSTMQVQSNGGIYTASVHTMGSAQRERIQSNLQSATPAFMDVQYGKTGITIGQTSASALKESTALSHSYALDNLGCKLTIEKMEEGNVCSTCQARGNFAVSGTGQTSMRTPGQAGQLTSNAALGRSTTSSKDVRTTSCQVGTLLAPTTVQISEVALQSRNADFSNLVGLKPGAVVYPAAIQMKSMLTDSSGIQVAELKDMSTMQVQSNGGIYTASVHTTGSAQRERIQSNLQSAAPAFMDVQYGKTGITIGQTSASALKESTALSHSYALDNLGCKLTIEKMEEGNVCSTCQARGNFVVSGTGQAGQMTSISTARTERVLQSAAKSDLSQVTYGYIDGKTVSCQVGTTLIPTVVQVADMDMTVSDPRMVKNLGLRPNAVLCPSTVELESKLTETSGIRVMDIRDVKEVGISFGKVTGKASLQDRDRSVRGLAATYEPPESCYVQFKSRQVPNLVGSEVAAPHMSSDRSVALGKRIDNNAGCTFRVRELAQTNVPEHFSQITLTSPSVISQSSWQRDTYQVVPTPNRPLCSLTQSATCQVGLVLEPTLLSVSGKVSAGHMNTTSGPGLQPSRLELNARLAEVPGVQLTSLSDTPNMTLQVGNQSYLAAVEVCDSVKRDLSKFGGMQRSLTETWTRPTSKLSSLGADNTAKLTTGQFSGDREGIRLSIEIPNIAFQPLKQQQVGKANAWRNSAKGYTTNTSETILEVTGLTNVGRRVRLRIPVDLTEILSTVDASVNASAPKQDFLGGSGIPKTYGKLCDVACEALIIPDTLEKRVQTVA